MSEFINNSELKKQTIKDIIRQLHEGKTVEEVKAQFEAAFSGVSATEISQVEGALIAEGLPVEEVQNLCDVHASIFKGSIEEIHAEKDLSKVKGHPVQILFLENRQIETLIAAVRDKLTEIESEAGFEAVKTAIRNLLTIGIHYKKKENLLFPFMEKYGITAPPKVMWGVDDEIRNGFKSVLLEMEYNQDYPYLLTQIEELLEKTSEMIFKEETIMVPMLADVMKPEDWKQVGADSPEIGFMIDEVPDWVAMLVAEPAPAKKEPIEGMIQLPSGFFSMEQLVAMLNTLPIDITFVNKEDVVQYFSEGPERAFPRTRSIIGRNVSNCHPPSSVHVVEKLVQDFKDGVKDQEDFWIKAGPRYILIRYYAVRNEAKEYLGVLEVTQDIGPIQDITGEKRLLS